MIESIASMLEQTGKTVQQHEWQISLNASDLIGLIGIVATILSIAFGLYQLLEARRARSDARRARALLLRQQISQQFALGTTRAVSLFRAVRQRNWEDCAETALLLCADLANAAGFPESLIGRANRLYIEVAMQAMESLLRGMPSHDVVIEEKLVQELMQHCQTILVAVSTVEGYMRLKTALGGEQDEQQRNKLEGDPTVTA